MMHKKTRNTILLSLLISFTLIFIFRSPIKVFVRDQVPEIPYLRLSWIKNIITGNDFGFYKYEIRLADQFSDINNYITEQQLEFSIKLKKNKSLNIFQTPPFFPGIGVDEVNTAYLDFYKDDLIYATKNGTFFNVKIDQNFLHFKPLKTNISEFLIKKFEEKNASINYFNPYTISKLGIKDILVDDNTLYVSYIESNNQGGYNTGILKANISDYLDFSKFYTPRNFISSTNKEFYPVQSGGRIVDFKQDSILLSVGEYRDRMSAQNLNTDNGKIIAINKNNSGSRVISLGHRNPQGLDYSKKFDYVISTEHGPAGGDEVNLIIDTENIKNFGWPISSYGIHYSVVASKTDSHGGDANRIVKEAPLHKNHSNYGFVEPLIYWDINPAVSEIRIINENENYGEFILSSLGPNLDTRPNSQRLLHYKFNKNTNETELINKIDVSERVRDIAYDKDSNIIYYVGESTGVIGFINL
jgi:hypothetical protein